MNTLDFYRAMAEKDKANAIALKRKRIVTQETAEIFMNVMREVVLENLIKGESINIQGFSKYEVIEVPEKMRRNPQNGEPCLVPAFKKVKIKPGKNILNLFKE